MSRGDGVPKPHLRDGVAWAAGWAVREDEASAPPIIEPGFMQRPVPSPSTSAPIEQNQRRRLDAVEQSQGGRPVVGVEGDAVHLPGRAGLCARGPSSATTYRKFSVLMGVRAFPDDHEAAETRRDCTNCPRRVERAEATIFGESQEGSPTRARRRAVAVLAPRYHQRPPRSTAGSPPRAPRTPPRHAF